MPLDFGYYSFNKKTGAKLIVIGTTSVIDQNMSTVSLSGSRTLTVFTNTWLYDSEIQFGVGNKINAYDHMIFKDSKDATGTIALLYIAPAILACIGVAVWLKRRYS